MATVVGALVGLALFLGTLPLARHAGRLDGDPGTTRMVRWGLFLKLMAAPAYLVVIGTVYGGGDYGVYSQQAAMIAHLYRSGHFAVSGLSQFSSQDRFVSYVAGWVYTVIGVSQLGAFFFFSWLAFWGQYLSYRAFRIALPDADHIRYRRLIFLFPSVLFWTATIGKDAIILFGLGLAVAGVARLFSKRRGGFVSLGAGVLVIMAVRPNIALVLFAGLVPAYVLGRPARRRIQGAASKAVGIVVILFIGSLMVPTAEHFLGIHNLGLNSINHRLKAVANDTSGAGSQSFGQTASTKSRPTVIDQPLGFPVDFVTVLWRPLPNEAPTTVTLAASLESLFLLGLTAASWRRGVIAVRRIRKQPYIGFACFYTGAFICAFASIGNFGILARERVQTLPAYFVIISATPRRRRGRLAELPPAPPSERVGARG